MLNNFHDKIEEPVVMILFEGDVFDALMEEDYIVFIIKDSDRNQTIGFVKVPYYDGLFVFVLKNQIYQFFSDKYSVKNIKYCPFGTTFKLDGNEITIKSIDVNNKVSVESFNLN